MTGQTTELDELLAGWRQSLHGKGLWDQSEILELESHLLDGVEELVSSGLSTDEAFLIATKRLGSASTLNKEFEKGSGFSRWRPRVLWMSMGCMSLLLLLALKNLILMPVLALGVSRGFGTFALASIAIGLPLALAFGGYKMTRRLGEAAEAVHSRSRRRDSWLGWGFAASVLLFASEFLSPFFLANEIPTESFGKLMLASAVGDFVCLMLLPLALCYLVLKSSQSAATTALD